MRRLYIRSNTRFCLFAYRIVVVKGLRVVFSSDTYLAKKKLPKKASFWKSGVGNSASFFCQAFCMGIRQALRWQVFIKFGLAVSFRPEEKRGRPRRHDRCETNGDKREPKIRRRRRKGERNQLS